ncbi:MFS transporter [Saccharothrix variisporea]|uniref:Putative MFS family arabinose efflux permease n=1 Tax=Saccharothrix variisporea TaxID=543527 RepID=A0A495XHH3_9PSEU|nr:MFS transporter [Saccharothrix variisporea]RKT71993.1 putative MFS family arabinose efflux permease [Saccharothrix variisporea]
MTPLLRDPSFRRYFIARTSSHLGDGLISIALLFGALRLGASPTEVGLVLLAGRLPVVVLTIAGGLAGDLISRRAVMVAADVVRCAAQALTALLLITGTAALWHLAVVQAVAGAATAFFAPAAAGLVADVVPEARRGQANALVNASQHAATLVGPVVSAALVATVGAGVSFAVDAATFAVSAFALVTLRVPDKPLPARPALLDALRHGWRDFRARPWLQATTVQVAVINGVCISPFLVLGPIIADEHLGGPLAWALIGNGYAVGALLGSALALRWRPQYPLRVAVTIPVALAPLLVLLAAGAPVPVLAAAAVPAGVQSALYAVFTDTARLVHVPADLVARATGFSTVVGLAAAPVGMALAGPVAERVGTSSVLVAGAVVAVVGVPVALAVRSVRWLPAVAGSVTVERQGVAEP